MNNLNNVVIEGRLTTDAKDFMKRSNDGKTAFGSFTIAVDRSYKKGEQWVDETSFFKVKGFGKGYENACKHMTKGSVVKIVGRLEQESWEKDGQKHSGVCIVADTYYPTYKRNDNANGPQDNSGGVSAEGFPF